MGGIEKEEKALREKREPCVKEWKGGSMPYVAYN